jgi:hypothetical protein
MSGIPLKVFCMAPVFSGFPHSESIVVADIEHSAPPRAGKFIADAKFKREIALID